MEKFSRKAMRETKPKVDSSAKMAWITGMYAFGTA